MRNQGLKGWKLGEGNQNGNTRSEIKHNESRCCFIRKIYEVNSR